MYDRYKVIKATRDQGQVHGYSVRGTQYPEYGQEKLRQMEGRNDIT